MSQSVPHFSLGTALPHRPPFAFVRQLLDCAPGQWAECSTFFPQDDPIFAGHFPQNPLVPGVILTEALAQTAGIAAASGFPQDAPPFFLLSAIRSMKFLAPVRPEEVIALRAEKLAQIGELWQFKVEARVRDELVADGQLVLSRAQPPVSTALA
jgi:3-hydroxyacyl-[acyl-carrier-protein] dehydratase